MNDQQKAQAEERVATQRRKMDRNLQDAAEGKVFAEMFSQFVNNMNKGPREKAVEFMLRDHCTLQQGMMRFIMLYIEGMANKTRGIDARNEDSLRVAKEIMKIQDRFLPFI